MNKYNGTLVNIAAMNDSINSSQYNYIIQLYVKDIHHVTIKENNNTDVKVGMVVRTLCNLCQVLSMREVACILKYLRDTMNWAACMHIYDFFIHT